MNELIAKIQQLYKQYLLIMSIEIDNEVLKILFDKYETEIKPIKKEIVRPYACLANS